jgi:hypothetical protein
MAPAEGSGRAAAPIGVVDAEAVMNGLRANDRFAVARVRKGPRAAMAAYRNMPAAVKYRTLGRRERRSAENTSTALGCDGDHSKFDSLFGAVLSMNCWRAEFDD